MERYDENSIKTLDYREACRQSIGMYIGGNSAENMQHLITEIVANSMDEAAAGFGNLIEVTIDVDTNQATVVDNGRGIPFKKNASGNYAIIEMCTNLHSGGKFSGQSNYKSSLGLNGVGATVTHALSSEFSIDVWREGEHCRFESYDGDYLDEPLIEPYSGSKQGSKVQFIPDATVFSGAKWNVEKIKEELQLHALLNNNIIFKLNVISHGKTIDTVSYCYTNGIKDMLTIKSADLKLLTSAVVDHMEVKGDNGDSCEVDMAFAYCDKQGETIYSFVNGGYTPNDGTHVSGWKTSYTNYMNKLMRNEGVLKDKDKNLSGDIIRRGLVLVLSIKMTDRPNFAEQTKLTLNSPSARKYVSQAVSQLTIDKKTAKQIIDKIMIEQHAEEAAQRKREAQEKITKGGRNLNSLRDLPEKLADASDFADAEIFFCEGDSAAGGCKETKSANQAVMPLRGKVKNCTCLELADAIKSDIIKDILNCLGCGIGEHFNIDNLRYQRIIILTDADPDGGHIELLLITLFLHHLPELITNGKVYASVPPLYRTINGKETKYWYEDDGEYRKYIRNHKNVKITRFKGLGEMSPDELFQTTMNPENRKLVQLTTENLEQTLELYNRLMGQQPSLRRDFIVKNKLSRYGDEETFGDDDYDDVAE